MILGILSSNFFDILYGTWGWVEGIDIAIKKID